MSELAQAISWSGVDARLSMFVVFDKSQAREILPPKRIQQPSSIRTYELVDDAGILEGKSVLEYDLIYPSVPEDLERVLRCWISAALTAGAALAWFAFEGSFDFDHLLTKDIAEQVYAVGIKNRVELSTNFDHRQSKTWSDTLASFRSVLAVRGL